MVIKRVGYICMAGAVCVMGRQQRPRQQHWRQWCGTSKPVKLVPFHCQIISCAEQHIDTNKKREKECANDIQ